MDTSAAPAPQRGLCAGAGRGHRLSVPVPGLSGAFPKGTMILVGLMGLGRIFFFLIKGKKKRNQAIEADPSFSASRCPCTPRDRQQADAVKPCGEVGQWAEGL